MNKVKVVGRDGKLGLKVGKFVKTFNLYLKYCSDYAKVQTAYT